MTIGTRSPPDDWTRETGSGSPDWDSQWNIQQSRRPVFRIPQEAYPRKHNTWAQCCVDVRRRWPNINAASGQVQFRRSSWHKNYRWTLQVFFGTHLVWTFYLADRPAPSHKMSWGVTHSFEVFTPTSKCMNQFWIAAACTGMSTNEGAGLVMKINVYHL